MSIFPKLTFSVTMLIISVLLASILRIYQLTKVPNGLYWDEMDAGYQAYSFIKTGKDYFGNLISYSFHSFADYRAPLYIYTTIPFIYIFGLSPLAVRLPASIFGILAVALFYFILKEVTGKQKLAWIGSMVLAFSPWHIQYSRMGFEVTLMLTLFLVGVYGFLKAINNPKWFMVSSVGFGLSIWAYNTAKLFVPMVFFLLIIIFRKDILKIKNKKYKALPFVIFGLLLILPFYDSIYKSGGQRFREISILTENISPQINNLRLEAALAAGAEKKLGLETGLLEKLFHNKPLYLMKEFSTNYLEAFSTTFLFVNGDPNLRHSPSAVAEMYKIESIGLLLGLFFMVIYWKNLDKKGLFLTSWVLLAPIPSALTRDGGNHATRLFFLLSILTFIVCLGLVFISSIKKKNARFISFGFYTFFWFIEIILFLQFYFVHYRWESAEPFQSAINESASLALVNEDRFDQVVIDAYRDSALMAYLFESAMDPAVFQNLYPWKDSEISTGIYAKKIGKTFLLPPGERNWKDILNTRLIKGKTLLIISSSQIKSDEALIQNEFKETKLIGTIHFPNNQPAFLVLEANL